MDAWGTCFALCAQEGEKMAHHGGNLGFYVQGLMWVLLYCDGSLLSSCIGYSGKAHSCGAVNTPDINEQDARKAVPDGGTYPASSGC
jgi:hypothetical protein